MTLNEILTIYLLFVLSGAVTMMLIIFFPALKIIAQLEPNHPILHPLGYGAGAVIMFVIFLLSGPMMLFVLARRDSFLQNFLKGLLNNED